jgi:hypothetical protein
MVGVADRKKFGSGLKKPYYISEGLVTIFGLKILQFLVADPDPGVRCLLALFGMEKSGSGINIPDPQNWK